MLILFDIDGTLFDDTGAARVGVRALYSENSQHDSLHAFESAWFTALEHHYDRYLSGELSLTGQRRARVRDVIAPTLTDDAADHLYMRYSEACESAWSLYPDVLSCLDSLADRQLGIVSNGQDTRQRNKLSRVGILERFECIVTSGEFGRAKPDSEIFLHACELSGAAPSNTLYVGDRYDVDAIGAREAGLTGVWLNRNEVPITGQESPVIASLAELPDLLEQLYPD